MKKPAKRSKVKPVERLPGVAYIVSVYDVKGFLIHRSEFIAGRGDYSPLAASVRALDPAEPLAWAEAHRDLKTTRQLARAGGEIAVREKKAGRAR